MNARRWTATMLLFILASVQTSAVTTVEVKVSCPICGTTNDFYDYASWGSYVYRYKSKYQLVFFPHTWGMSIYLCKHCHFSMFLWDWKNFPSDKSEAAKKVLQGVKVSKDFKSYTEVSSAEKLQIAEKIYQLLGKDEQFWAFFYRILGYHLDNDNKGAEAAQARQRALELEEKMLANPAKQGERKEILVVCGALKHFLGDDAAALKRFAEASSLTYSSSNSDNAKGYDAYLTELIKDYRQRIKDGTVPTDYRQE